MNNYTTDRSFTDFVHEKLAVPLYLSLGFKIFNIKKEELDKLDMNDGIDYILVDQNQKKIYIQERFRDNFYKDFNDVTLRYRRDNNANTSRHESEFYKIKAEYLVYGIIDGKSFLDARHTITKFVKLIILDVQKLLEKIKNGEITIGNIKGLSCKIINGKLCCPIIENHDFSSSFVPFDIKLIKELGWDDLILYKEGYF